MSPLKKCYIDSMYSHDRRLRPDEGVNDVDVGDPYLSQLRSINMVPLKVLTTV